MEEVAFTILYLYCYFSLCYGFRSNPETLTLTAVSHLVYGVVKTEQPVSDVMVTILSSLDQSTVTLGPLTLNISSQSNASKKEIKGPQEYRFSHWTR